MPKYKYKTIFLGRKKYSVHALNYLLSNNFDVKYIVSVKGDDNEGKLKNIAKKNNIIFFNSNKIFYDHINEVNLKNYDFVFSYLYPYRIKKPLLSLPKLGAINFHPGPLPDYKSWASYNYALLNDLKYWGATAHYMDENFDTGPIIDVIKFKISKNDNAHSLEKNTQNEMFILFKQTINKIIKNQGRLPTKNNTGGIHWTKQDMENNKLIDLEKDSVKEIDKKIRAYFFPPYSGAKIVKNNKEYTLINDEILEYIKKLIEKNE